MHRWLSLLLAITGTLVLAPFAAWVGRRYGRSIKGGVALASVMLGMGAFFDPPVRALIEVRQEPIKGDEENGEPKDDLPQDPSSAGRPGA
jgi:hypothetical protein